MKYKIKHRYTDSVLFEADIPDDTPSGLAVRAALEQATKARANLARANLAGANLDGAYLARAILARAYLARANLARANLAGANLDGAYLDGANLDGANLARANLAGAYLDGGLKLVGARPIFQIGPIGSRSDFFIVYITDHGLRFDAGCQRQITREAFEKRLSDTHGDNEHAREYRAALALIDVHAELWTPVSEQASVFTEAA